MYRLYGRIETWILLDISYIESDIIDTMECYKDKMNEFKIIKTITIDNQETDIIYKSIKDLEDLENYKLSINSKKLRR